MIAPLRFLLKASLKSETTGGVPFKEKSLKRDGHKTHNVVHMTDQHPLGVYLQAERPDECVKHPRLGVMQVRRLHSLQTEHKLLVLGLVLLLVLVLVLLPHAAVAGATAATLAVHGNSTH